jgi:LacI family transcriptional regulator
VPQDVAVIGYDNWDAMAAHSRPPLTSVDLKLQQLGRVAAQRLASAVEGHPASGVEVLPVRLVTRSSTAPLD